ncbi:MAG TPA: sulfite exporter TauE/SafE family protein [Pseudolabrys sp.]|nr:sulfite exporter TauE/SafE family protein [Pseudolabrys sp.]
MTLLAFSLLVGAGVFAGLLASIIGGAAVVVYPAMIMAGIPPQAAAVSNLVALMPATMLAALSDRTQLPPFNRAFVSLIVASVAGAGLGAMLLLLTPGKLFNGIVPLLLGFATLLFAFAEKIGAYIRKRAEGRGHDVTFNVSSLKVLLPVSFYGGYFGAGVGILILGVFSIATGGDYRSANVAKNLVSSLNGLVASIVFIVQGAVVWPQTLALMAGTVVGGIAGAHIARVIPRNVVRVLVVAVGAALTVSFARRYWF